LTSVFTGNAEEHDERRIKKNPRQHKAFSGFRIIPRMFRESLGLLVGGEGVLRFGFLG
jgi:hypothetical protein